MRYFVHDPNGENLDYILFKVYGQNWSKYWKKAYQDNPHLLDSGDKIEHGTELELAEDESKKSVVDVWN